MKQLVQSMRHWTVSVLDVPPPQLRGPGVLVQTTASLISAGTERAAMEFAKGSLLDKARSRPDLVSQVVQKVRRDGFFQTLETAVARLDRPVAPGYACAGIVREVSPEVDGVVVGDRVACAGAGHATHAEVNYVPKNLLVPIPKRPTGEWVRFDEAAFTTLGAIALHGTRLAIPQLGDRAVVVGLGAIGLLAVQILRAHGCRVAGIDIDNARNDLARALRADVATTPAEAQNAIASWTRGLGADLVLIAAATTGSEPAVLAAELSRDKGRIVAVGATGLELPRRLLYHKELSVVVSRSYGPGRYDPEYEERGRDYPLPYVRWTERENMRAFLDLVADGSVDVGPLISHRFSIDDAPRAYHMLEHESVLGIVLEYPQDHRVATGPVRVAFDSPRGHPSGRIGVSVIGTGNFARSVLLPAIARPQNVELRGTIAATGLSARSAADKFGFNYCSTDASDVLNDPRCDTVVIATRHDAHGRLVVDALAAGKAVFVEKPLCLHEQELEEIRSTMGRLRAAGGRPFLMVGFNRRFARATEFVKRCFEKMQPPVNILYRVNAGKVPHGSWVSSAEEGGGRILGEVCHFVDLCSFIAGSPVVQVSAARSSGHPDDVVVNLRMANGSIATVAYFVDGDPAVPKERIEVFGGGASGVIDDFRRAQVSVNGRKKRLRGFGRPDKGHRAEVASFISALRAGDPSPVRFEEAANVTQATFAILKALESTTVVNV